MTKYILHGGYTSEPNDSNKGFFNEMIKDLPEGGHILIVYFAREESEWNTLFSQDEKQFMNAAQDKKIILTLANKDAFTEQITSADVIYIRGGKIKKLLKFLQQYPNFSNLIKDKVVAGSSAGAYVISKFYHSRDQNEVFEGLGLIPYNVVAHFDGDQKILDSLKEKSPDLETIILKDYEYKIVNV